MEKNLNLAKSIRIARLLRGYSQENVATELGIKQQTYQLLENGITGITPEKLKSIAFILKMEIEFIELLHDTDLIGIILKDYLRLKKTRRNE